jgi:hypothetical protein
MLVTYAQNMLFSYLSQTNVPDELQTKEDIIQYLRSRSLNLPTPDFGSDMKGNYVYSEREYVLDDAVQQIPNGAIRGIDRETRFTEADNIITDEEQKAIWHSSFNQTDR